MNHLGRIIHNLQCQKKIYYSFELVSSEKNNGIYTKFFSQVKECSPLFYALTWHNNVNTNFFLPLKYLPQFPKNTLLHLAARGNKCDTVVKILDRILELGITNLFIIRGDDPVDSGDFHYAIDLIKFIIERYKKKFCIGVAGYPDNHPESPSKAENLYYLKQKVDAGADFIITQITLESSSFINFVKDCTNNGIFVPIIPFIMPISNYKSFVKMVKICSLTVPQYLYDDLENLKNDTEAVQKYGMQLTMKIINDIISSGCTCIFHLCTLNNASITMEVCKRIDTLNS